MSNDQKIEIKKGTVRVFLMFAVLSIYSMGLAYAVDAAMSSDENNLVGNYLKQKRGTP